MTVVEQMNEAQERVLTGMETAQTRIIEMNRRVADAMTDALPDSDRLNLDSLPSFMTPPEDLPRPEEMIDRYFDFTAKVAKANRAFYKEMIGIWVPAQSPKAKKVAAKTTPKKTTAKKTSAKKSTSAKASK